MESVLNSLIPNVVCGFVYGALVESYASEHNSRMMAMQTATDSAKQMLHDLVVGMGIRPQALAVLQTPLDDRRSHPLALAGGGQPVDGAIGQGIVQPCTVLDHLIGGVRPPE